MADLLHPDAKLIELGRQFEVTKTEARKLEKEWLRLRAAYEATAVGIPDWSDGGADAHKKAMRETGYKAVSDTFNAKHGEVVGLMRAIHKAKATTLEGFAIKAAAVAFDQSDFEVDDPVPTDVAERQMYRLARDMAKAARREADGHPDADLLVVDEHFNRVRQEQIALYTEVGDDESPETMERIGLSERKLSVLSDTILFLTPKTVDGLRVVAKVWAVNHVCTDGSWPLPSNHPDERAVHAVMRWLVEGGAS